MKRENIEDVYRLSPVQQGMLFHTLHAPEAGMYFEQFHHRTPPGWNPEVAERAWREVVARHTILRTSFLWEGLDEPVQIVHRQVDLPVLHEDWRGLPTPEQEERLRRFLSDDRSRGFDAARVPLLRLAFLRLADDAWEQVVSYHHLLLDGWSIGLLAREVAAAYLALAGGRPFAGGERRPYRDYIAWLMKQDLGEAEAYWRRVLAGFESPTPIGDHSLDRAPGAHHAYTGQRTLVPPAATAALQEAARQRRLTLHTLVEGAWSLTLARYAGRQDLVFGTTVSGRPPALPGSDAMVGCFINTLPVRVRLSVEDGLVPWLRRLQAEQLELRRFEYSPLVEVRRWSEVPGDQPLFESLLVYENFPLDAAVSTRLEGRFQRTNYPLAVVAEPGRELQLRLGYDRSRCEPAAIGRMLRHLQEVLESLPAAMARAEGEAGARIADLPALPAAERHQLLVEWTDPGLAYPPPAPLHELVAAQAARTPDAEVLSAAEERLTHRELQRRAGALARHLRGLGVGPETIVGVCLERSPALVVALLGVLEAGGAYLPLDPTLPAERLGWMVEDSGTRLVVTAEGLGDRLPRDGAWRTVRLDASGAAAGADAEDGGAVAAPAAVDLDHPAYVIYTSGSTGRPKGVVVPHLGAANHLTHDQVHFLLGGDRFLQKTTASFDVSVVEIFATMLVPGGRTVLARPDGAQDPAYLLEVIQREGITNTSFPPTLLSLLLDDEAFRACRTLRSMVTGGETVPADLPDRFHAAMSARLFNRYGPTEASISVTSWVCVPGAAEAVLPIGRPIAGAAIYLLDRHLRPVPLGALGEIYLGGPGLARGYLNRPELTAEVFVPNPFAGAHPELGARWRWGGADKDWKGGAGSRLYKTGDLARYRRDGALEFAGRVDHQVKIRGFRVELGEIEAALDLHPAVREAVVLDHGEGNAKVLVAYVQPEPAAEAPTPAVLRAFLAERLPSYMVPSVILLMAELPLTATGKVDRRALPAPGGLAAGLTGEGDESWEAPRGPIEEVIAAIWSDVLELDGRRIGRLDSFFELGGHSLLATKVVSRLRETFGTDFPLAGLFRAAVLADLGELVESTLAAADAAPAPPLRRLTAAERAELEQAGGLPLSFAQERLWFLAQLEPASAAYNLPNPLRLRGRLDVALLRRCLAAIPARHEALRTRFALAAGPDGAQRPVQVVLPPAPVALPPDPAELPIVDLAGLPDAVRTAAVRTLLNEDAQRPFDLARGPLLRGTLLRLAGEEHVALFTMHHIAADGWSIGLLVRELSALYRAGLAGADLAAALPELPIQYADFAVWQRGWLQGEVLERQLAYWRERLAGAPPLLELPTDRPRPPLQTYRGGRRVRQLPAALAADLAALLRRSNATLFMGLLAGFDILLSRLTGQEDLAVGLPIANRNRLEIEGVIGFFVNTLVLRADLAGGPGFGELLGRVREVTLGAYAHQDLPFEKLVEELHPRRNLAHSPLFQVALVLQNAAGGDLVLPGLTLSTLALRGATAKFDLSLNVAEGVDGLTATLEYSSDLFDRSTAERLLAHFQTVLEGAVADPGRSLHALPVLSAAERRQLVEDWNATAAAYPGAERCIHELIAAQAAQTPGAPAVELAGEVLTYGELDARANRLARTLRGMGVGPEVLVGIALDRSLELLVGLLAVLKAGGAYVPLDPGYPGERLAFMLEDSGAPVLLAQAHTAERLPAHRAETVLLAAGWQGEGSAAPLPPSGGPDHPAYVIYTSGSTGRPKGVVNSHRGVVNRLLWMQAEHGLTPADAVLIKTPVSFDVSVWELFGPLLAGARLVVARPDGHRDPAYLARTIAERGVTIAHFVPSMLQVFLEDLEAGRAAGTLRRVHASGEALPWDLVQRFAARLPGVELLNLYGPTEAAVEVSAWRCQPGDGRRAVPIGHPIANVRLHVLDRHGNPAPVGVAGELLIGGVALARGYLRRPDLTAERFVPDPFVGLGDARPGDRLYRTGDLVRVAPDGSPDRKAPGGVDRKAPGGVDRKAPGGVDRKAPGGAIEYLGRLDHQVKVRGFRIELGEIEAALAAHPGIREAVVVAREDGLAGDRRLVAYLVAAGRIAPAELRQALAVRLPEFMVPAAFVQLDALPLNPSGKVDRRALPAPEEPARGARGERPAALPRGRAERLVAEVWRDVLGLEQVGADDNFFDLGGHSLLMIRVHARLRAAFGRDDLPLIDLFRHPTVRALAGHLSGEGAGAEAGGQDAARVRGEGRRGAGAGEAPAIAIVGLVGRYPGAATVDELWRNLCGGVESISFFSGEELAAAGVAPEQLADPRYVRARGVVAGTDLFAASFFDVPPREAQVLDPQQRVFLECAWEALEDAGCDPRRFPGRIGVFAGVGMNHYLMNLAAHPELVQAVGRFQVMIGNDKDYLATRVAYKLGLRGPALTVQTACSTSLVAVQLACESLRTGQSDLALAGGVTIGPKPDTGYRAEKGGIASPDGHTRPFDARGEGTVAADGAGVVVLKRLADAVAEGDRIHAVIRGWALNNDGSDRVGFTAPGVAGQAEVIAEAQAMAGFEPASIGYVEAHGTGTPLGDPIEMAALAQAFGGDGEVAVACAVGSIKGNLGHTDAAAGVAGLIKAALAVETGLIPPSLHFAEPNPRIDFGAGRFHVPTALTPWQPDGGPRRAGVSSFGIGGTNAHVVLEQAPAVPAPDVAERPWQVLPLSAKTPAALERAAERLAEWIAGHPEADLGEVAWTLQTGRVELGQRRAVVARDLAEARVALSGRQAVSGAAGEPQVAFLFPGQGALEGAVASGAVAALYRAEPVFRAGIDGCTDAFAAHLGWRVRDVLGITTDQVGGMDGRLARTGFAQPALFALEHALAGLWMEWGIRPSALLGHSLGEYVAATAAGVMTLEAAAALVAARARLMEALPDGAMLALPLSEEQVSERLARLAPEPGLSLAAVNGPRRTVVSGPEEEVAAFGAALAAEGIAGRRLATSHAFHSAMMDPVLADIRAAVAGAGLEAPAIPYLSNLTGDWITAGQATDPDAWVAHLRRPVRFADGLARLLAEPGRLLLEVGPGETLGRLARQQAAGRAAVIPSLPEAADGTALGQALARLWTAGAEVDWQRVQGGRRRRVALPTYPFERERYWVDRGPAPQAARGAALVKRERIAEWFYRPVWRSAPLAMDEAAERASWLVFADPDALGRRVTARLEAAGAEVVTVFPGEAFSCLGEATFTAAPGKAEDMAELLAALRAQGRTPARALHLWGLQPLNGNAASLDRAQERGFASLLHLVQAWVRAFPAAPLALTVATTGLQKVLAGDAVEPAKAALLGLAKVVPQEHPALRLQSVDVEPEAAANGAADRTAARLLAEAGADDAPEVAWRGDERWVQDYEPLAEPAGPLRLRAGGAYLITGGLGRLGLLIAEVIAAEAPGARLVLVGRTGVPEPATWPDWLASHPDTDPASRRLRGLQALEAAGAEVLVARADVADPTALRDALQTARGRFGRLDGVIHAAGLVGATVPVRDTTAATAELQLGPKVRGALALEALLAELPVADRPDFVILISSLAAVLGGLGMAAYAAANRTLDALAEAHSPYPDKMSGEPAGATAWLAVDWDAWRFAGRTATAVPPGTVGAALARLAITPEEGREAIRRTFRLAGLPRVVVSTADLAARRGRWTASPGPTAAAPAAEAPRAALLSRPELARPYAAPRSSLERAIAEVWQDALGFERIGLDDDFFELGGDSLAAVRVIARLTELLRADLSPHTLLLHPTVAGLAATLAPTAAAGETAPTAGCLVPLQTGDRARRRPLFLVHPVGGHVFFYERLARRLGADRPVYGLRARGLEAGEEPQARLEEMAASYVAEVRALEPAGPYLLGGSSLGGMVALEMAQQLRTAGEEVALLALVDTPGDGQMPRRPEDESDVLAELLHGSLDLAAEELRRLDPEARLCHVLERAREAGGLPPDLDLPRAGRLLRVATTLSQAMFAYRPRPYDGRMVYFRAAERRAIDPPHPELPWIEIAAGGLEVHVVPGNHITMHQGTHVEELGRRLRQCLDRVEREGREAVQPQPAEPVLHP